MSSNIWNIGIDLDVFKALRDIALPSGGESDQVDTVLRLIIASVKDMCPDFDFNESVDKVLHSMMDIVRRYSYSWDDCGAIILLSTICLLQDVTLERTIRQFSCLRVNLKPYERLCEYKTPEGLVYGDPVMLSSKLAPFFMVVADNVLHIRNKDEDMHDRTIEFVRTIADKPEVTTMEQLVLGLLVGVPKMKYILKGNHINDIKLDNSLDYTRLIVDVDTSDLKYKPVRLNVSRDASDAILRTYHVNRLAYLSKVNRLLLDFRDSCPNDIKDNLNDQELMTLYLYVNGGNL